MRENHERDFIWRGITLWECLAADASTRLFVDRQTLFLVALPRDTFHSPVYKALSDDFPTHHSPPSHVLDIFLLPIHQRQCLANLVEKPSLGARRRLAILERASLALLKPVFSSLSVVFIVSSSVATMPSASVRVHLVRCAVQL